MKSIHIGDVIRQKVEESGLSIAQFASQINRTRTTVYDIFSRKSIDIDLLLSISEVLNFNFLREVYLKEELAKSYNSEQSTHYIINIEVDEQQLRKFATDISLLEVLNVIEKKKLQG